MSMFSYIDIELDIDYFLYKQRVFHFHATSSLEARSHTRELTLFRGSAEPGVGPERRAPCAVALV